MKNFLLYSIATSAVLLVAPHHAHAQELVLHLPMEATEENGGKIYTNNDGSATVVEGRMGNAVKFTGEAVFAKPFRFDRNFYPQVTITAWVKQPTGPLGTRTIFNSGNKVNFVLRNGGGTLSMSADGTGVNHFRSKVPTEEWVLVAAVHDARTGKTRLHLGDSEPTREGVAVRAPGEPRLYGNPDAPNIATMPDTDKEPYIFVGGSDALTYYGTSGELIIDDVRVYAGLLSEEQIASIRSATTEAQLEIQSLGETEETLINGPAVDGG